MDKSEFAREWADSIERGAAAVFIGAGLSQSAGYPSWSTLLRDVANKLDLDIDNEHDLAAVAQYALNEQLLQRSIIAQLIKEKFPPVWDPPQPFRILARLPIRHIWTTNYDQLIETAWRLERKAIDVKSRNGDLGVEDPWAQSILYKMHGSVDQPTDVVIAKDDYELYRRERPGFMQILTGDLVTRSVLFLGFSFTDPNISYLFAGIREAYRDKAPTNHFTVVRKPQMGPSPDAEQRFKVAMARHKHWVKDLIRYGIQCVEIDDFAEIDQILLEVELRIASRSVFVSGSMPETGMDSTERAYVEAVAREVGASIARTGKRLVSGYGLVVGSAAIAGALGVILHEPAPNLEKRLLLRPFPRTTPDGMSRDDFNQRYRESMIQQAGSCVVICGLKDYGSGAGPEISKGVRLEIDAARRLNCPIVPIGATGGTAKAVWDEMKAAGQLPLRLSSSDFELLGDRSVLPEALAAIVSKALN